MIKDFPEFGQLEVKDKNEVLKLTADFLHYSDFSFSNMWSWDIAFSKRGFSRLNGNLIIRMFDYKTNKPFFSICGSKMQNETVSTLLKFAQRESVTSPLKLVPEEFAQKITLPSVKVKEDRDNFDYIYSVDELKTFDGGKFKQRRNEVNALIAAYPKIEARELDIKNPSAKKEISCLFHRWAKNKIAKGDEYESNEGNAFNNMLILAETYSLILVGIYIKDRMVAFVVAEIRNSDYAVGHFAKTDSAIKGVSAYLIQSLARILSARDIKYFNYEQDLGLQNLRIAKERFRPAFFLKKYTACYNKKIIDLKK
ncbi:MAG TPA: phosphatidylglycerol lysyltransferase domain-containing protein [Candidatus Paceibacterota bacterium]|nr:phosphatidylglycerol lysyltransferase domain-containing protein [Candidatus Paceibacterota bacterium]